MFKFPFISKLELKIYGMEKLVIKFWDALNIFRQLICIISPFLRVLIRVNDKFRKKGNGIKVINHLIDEAKKLKIKKLSLETGAGIFFNPARKLFKKFGFKICEPFSHYKDDTNSVYMHLLLSN